MDVPPEILKGILESFENISKINPPYEYVCWKNILSDINSEPFKFDFKTHKLSDSEFESILQADFTDYWFLDSKYSDEFEDFIKLSEQTSAEDFDKIIDENIEKVFYKEEYNVWSERILNVSELKALSGDTVMAEKLFSLYNDKDLIREFFKNILRKSLYEYYFAKNDVNKIKKIEEMWVK